MLDVLTWQQERKPYRLILFFSVFKFYCSVFIIWNHQQLRTKAFLPSVYPSWVTFKNKLKIASGCQCDCRQSCVVADKSAS